MKRIHIDRCPVCKSDELLKSLLCNDYLVSKTDFTLCECKDCGFAFTQDFPSEDEIGPFYESSDYISHTDTHEGVISKLYHLARKISLKSKSKIIAKYAHPKADTLLDIGSGTGYFLHYMQMLKWKTKGVEKSSSAREYSKKMFGIDAEASESLFTLDDNSVDVITMWHVLEHVEKLGDTMDTLHRIMKDDGTAFIALPNKRSSDARYYKDNWAAYDVPRHLWHFSIKDFKLFANNHGFDIVAIKPMYFDAFYISMLSEKNKGTSFSSLVGLTKGAFFFLGSLMNIEKCSSVIYILKKQKYTTKTKA